MLEQFASSHDYASPTKGRVRSSQTWRSESAHHPASFTLIRAHCKRGVYCLCSTPTIPRVDGNTTPESSVSIGASELERPSVFLGRVKLYHIPRSGLVLLGRLFLLGTPQTHAS